MINIRNITFVVLLLNVCLLWGEVPIKISLLALISVVLSSFKFPKAIKQFIKIVLLFSSIALLKFVFRNLLIAESAISFVLILSTLKFWELDNENDHYNMFLILALCECSIYLLNPSFIIFFGGLIKMIFYFYYILKIRNYDLSQLNFKRLFLIIAPALFTSLVLFYTFPRFTQGFLNTGTGSFFFNTTENDIQFKKLGPLNLTDKKMFKVLNFDDKKPIEGLYWRTGILWNYNGSEWTSSQIALQVDTNKVREISEQQTGFPPNYTVEPNLDGQTYFPILDGTLAIIKFRDEPSKNYFWFLDRTIKAKTLYKITTYDVFNIKESKIKNLFDNSFAPKSTRIKSKDAQFVREKYFPNFDLRLSVEDRIKEVTHAFGRQNFFYTLNPPQYPSLEEFLLRGTGGYCTHFATSFAYLLRIYEIPSRVVVGYLGGIRNPFDSSIIVRELDAHAWVEVFTKEKGWFRIDPTELIAPARLTLNAADFNGSNKKGLFSDLFGYMQNASFLFDSLNSKFNSEIFNLDRDSQSRILELFFPKNMNKNWVFVFALIFGFAVFYFSSFLFQLKYDQKNKRYRKFLKKLARVGIVKESYETASNFKKRAIEILPNEKSYIEIETESYIRSNYKNN